MNQKQFVFERKYAKKLAELQPNANNQKLKKKYGGTKGKKKKIRKNTIVFSGA